MSSASGARLVILDRDGTINRDSVDYVKSASEWNALPRALEAIGRLCRAGWTVCVATNQSGIGRGLFSISDLHEMHQKMRGELATHGGEIDGIYFCPHVPDDRCDCRKPKPGLLQQIATRYRRNLAGVPVIGDSERDLLSAESAGARPILVRTGNGRRTLRENRRDDVEVYDDLAAAVDALLTE
ncbi:MAG: D-glycero-beta-D-manno-heptose 1,7-bisphosphate 7-phosphatase [Gammaproteobacteria bacterium]|nr:D-glycero-beta-D-manno-heptose 1,7-bisphosphate 7-phosphatase [Gammaproteobacteria bacterium]NNF60130.1 D-glycero-beta-D-manno-heptose 1,7-bisphosphate 7-phosphatase [Gammaproteobacteria bacterium]NNM21542.1 D-glycero-beta-D-manno-heptose 1,7-bisphosphate 7-phosphatase [Gammaproteobacteria bacterium]